MANTKTTLEKALTDVECAFLADRDHKIYKARGSEQRIVKLTCGRCGGSGSYSWCERFGTNCFGCMDSNGQGRGYVFKDARATIVLLKGQEARERKRAREAVAAEISAEAEAYANEANGFGYLSHAQLAECKRLVEAVAQELKAKAAKQEKADAMYEQFGDIVQTLRAASRRNDDFCASIADEIENDGRDPREFSPRCKAIVIDVVAKGAGRRNSKAYDAEYEAVESRLCPVAEDDSTDESSVTNPDTNVPCTHEGEKKWWLKDARGIECAPVCCRCVKSVKAKYRPEIFTNPNYWADEPINPS
jgi:hypothetical protein